MKPNVKKQLSIAACIYLGQVMVGFGLGWSAPIIPKLMDIELSPLPDVITETEASLIGSLLYLGTITGPYISGFLSNIIGRKPCLLLGGSVTLLSFVILAVANNLAMIFSGRILTGLGTGILFVVNLVYLGEMASTNLRGILLTVTGIFSTFGMLLVYSIGPYLPFPITGFVGALLTAIYCIAVFFIPETPLFFIMKDDHDSAKQVLYKLGRVEDVDNLSSYKNDKEKLSFKQEWGQIFTMKSNRKALIITLTLNIFQQMSGFIAVIFFATTIFEIAGSSIEPNIATIVIGLAQLFASSITPFFVERNGRKILLLLSTAFCCLSLVILGVYFYLHDRNPSTTADLQWLPLVTLIVFLISYDLGFGIIPNALIGEMFESNVRGPGSTVTITIGWLCGFAITTVFGYIITNVGAHVMFWTFSGACALAFLFTVVYVPETKGKSLPEIQEMLNK